MNELFKNINTWMKKTLGFDKGGIVPSNINFADKPYSFQVTVNEKKYMVIRDFCEETKQGKAVVLELL